MSWGTFGRAVAPRRCGEQVARRREESEALQQARGGVGREAVRVRRHVSEHRERRRVDRLEAAMAAQQHLSRGADDQVGEGGGGGARGATTQRQRVRARRLRRGAEAGLG